VLISSAYFLPPKNENDAASDTGVSPPPTEAPAPTPEPLIIQQPLEVCVPVWANIPFLYDSDVKVFEHGSYQGQGSMFISGCGQILDGYTWGDNIPETKAVDADYFSDAVFIGNSLEEGFMLYSKLSTPDYFATKSITVVNIYTEKVVNTGGGNYITIMDALSKRSYKKVYILLGLNEIGYETDEITRRFSGLIDDIRKIQPKAEIYLQSLTPVTKEQSSSGSIFNNNSIRKLNDTLKLLAAEKKIHFVYIFEALANSEGCLPSEASQDGIHPYSKYYMQWRDYLMTHTVTEAKK
jgi:lysophospholipase L1-like esterase